MDRWTDTDMTDTQTMDREPIWIDEDMAYQTPGKSLIEKTEKNEKCKDRDIMWRKPQSTSVNVFSVRTQHFIPKTRLRTLEDRKKS